MGSREIDIPANNEFRFEVEFDSSITVKIRKGIVEYYGQELSKEKEYTFNGQKDESVVPFYLNLQVAIENLRKEAKRENNAGPKVNHRLNKVLITGIGRSTLTRTLANYSVRQFSKPLYVDLDVSNGNILFPGLIGASPVERLNDCEEGFNPSGSLLYYYGHLNITENSKHYKALVTKLSQVVKQRMQIDTETNNAGMLICTSRLNELNDTELLEFIRSSFEVSGNERLFSHLSNFYKDKPNIKILKAPFPSGYVDCDSKFKRSRQMHKIREYFYGYQNELCPYSLTLSFKDFQIKKIGETFIAPTSALPIGASRKVDETRLVNVEPTNALLHSILAVSAAENGNEASVLDSNAIGFLWVTEVDESKQKMTVLATLPTKIPKHYFILGMIKWIEK